ncbi:MAG: adenylate/guanylate cyclase domain-containing protein [Leptospirales bacterium]|nr:adenylate/guanylate cyclase domain-containing protein [Leptospirales bacterium]
MRKFLAAIASFGLDPGVPAEEAKYVRVLNSNVFVVVLMVTGYALFFLTFTPEIWMVAVIGFIATPLYCVVFLLHYTKHFRTARTYAPILSSLVVISSSAVMGKETDFHYFLLSVVVAIFFTFPRAEKKLMGGLIILQALSFLGLQVWFLDHQGIQHVRPTMLGTIQFAAAVGVFFLVVGFSFYVFSIYRVAETALAHEKNRSEHLLLNILPAQIAEQLKEHHGRIAERFEEATILFTDLVNFTPLSEKLSAEDLVALLDEVFSRFDVLIDRHRVEKIKTIGDSYMVVSGVPSPRGDHVEVMADLALDMLETMKEIQEKHNLKIRIGIHSGPVVAGVIGKRKFSYDLWGDSVNTASRMESHGSEGMIHVSPYVFERLRDRFIFESRGIIDIKGKGPMPTYFLVGRIAHPEALSHSESQKI